MDIQINGAIVIFEDDEVGEYKHLMCVCGHELYQHASYVQHYYPDPFHHTAYQSQCVMCPVDVKENTFGCSKFRIKE